MIMAAFRSVASISLAAVVRFNPCVTFLYSDSVSYKLLSPSTYIQHDCSNINNRRLPNFENMNARETITHVSNHGRV